MVKRINLYKNYKIKKRDKGAIILIGSLVIVETDSKVMLHWPSQFEMFFSRNYGRSKIEIAEKFEMD